MEELNEPIIKSVESFPCGCRQTVYSNREPYMDVCLACTYGAIGQMFRHLSDIHKEQHEARFDDPPPLEETILEKGGSKPA